LGTASLFVSRNRKLSLPSFVVATSFQASDWIPFVDASASFPIQSNQYTAVFWTLVAVYILYTISSLFGVVGSITQRRRMVLFFSILNWIMVVLTLIATFAVWIILLVKKSDVESACEAAVSNSIAANDSPYHSPVTIPSQQIDVQNACQEGIRNATIAGGVIVFVGNALQVS
jgi:hypothetical protein